VSGDERANRRHGDGGREARTRGRQGAPRLDARGDGEEREEHVPSPTLDITERRVAAASSDSSHSGIGPVIRLPR